MTQPAPDFLRHHLRTLPIHRTLVRSVEARLFWELRDQLKPPILDVGCGDGTFAEIAFPRYHGRIAGIDPRRADVQEAQARGPYGVAMVADGAAMPFVSDSFPTAISNCVLEHVLPLDATLREVARVLQPGGRFFTGVVGHRFADLLLGTRIFGPGYGRWFNKISVHHNTLTPEGWTARFEAAGLEVEEWHYYVPPWAVMVFDASHYYGAPSLLTRKLLGRWMLYPALSPNRLWEPVLRRIYEAAPPIEGPYIFFRCRKPQHLR
ncbi:MAG: class I SAM-dependent methyltransferase [Herpetosiphon sp.]